MTEATRIRYLRVALVVVGVIFVAAIYPLSIVWPTGWSWHTGHSDYLPMIIGIYATLGVFLLIASRDPLAHRSLMGFTVWSSVVYGGSWRYSRWLLPRTTRESRERRRRRPWT
jgi:hypothetical protein